MAKAASLTDLQELHSLIARSLNQRITQDMEDGLPTDAATHGARHPNRRLTSKHPRTIPGRIKRNHKEI